MLFFNVFELANFLSVPVCIDFSPINGQSTGIKRKKYSTFGLIAFQFVVRGKIENMVLVTSLVLSEPGEGVNRPLNLWQKYISKSCSTKWPYFTDCLLPRQNFRPSYGPLS